MNERSLRRLLSSQTFMRVRDSWAVVSLVDNVSLEWGIWRCYVITPCRCSWTACRVALQWGSESYVRLAAALFHLATVLLIGIRRVKSSECGSLPSLVFDLPFGSMQTTLLTNAASTSSMMCKFRVDVDEVDTLGVRLSNGLQALLDREIHCVAHFATWPQVKTAMSILAAPTIFLSHLYQTCKALRWR